MLKAITVLALLVSCVDQEPEMTADECGPAFTIDDADFWAQRNGDGTVTLTSDQYYKVMVYIEWSRDWVGCHTENVITTHH